MEAKKSTKKKVKTKTTKSKSAAKKTKSVAKKDPGLPLQHAVGRRKKAVARVWVRKGSGKLTINERDYTDYFDTEVARLEATRPFQVVPVSSNYDVQARVEGGGLKGQAGAVKLGISKALVGLDEAIRSTLREHDLLTVDARRRERKKYGQRGARRKFQFVKR